MLYKYGWTYALYNIIFIVLIAFPLIEIEIIKSIKMSGTDLFL